MQKSLKEALYLSDAELDQFLIDLYQSKGQLAGSFPLMHYCQPKLCDWHQETRSTIRHLAWVAKQILDGVHLPQEPLERIGNYLQVAPLQHDWTSGAMDIDLFFHLPREVGHNFFYNTEVPEKLHQFFYKHDWHVLQNDQSGSEGFYLLLPKVISATVWVKNRTLLNIIYVSCPVDQFIAENFDFSFCKVAFNGNTEPQPVSVRGLANVEKYSRILQYIRNRIDIWNEAIEEQVNFFINNYKSTLPGFSLETLQDLAHRLADNMQARLDKYERRLFTVDNRGELLALISQARAI